MLVLWDHHLQPCLCWLTENIPLRWATAAVIINMDVFIFVYSMIAGDRLITINI